MSDNKDNIVSLDKHRQKKNKEKDPEMDPTMEVVLNMSDDIDDVLEAYLNAGVAFELVISVLSNRLGMLISAGRAAGVEDMTDLCIDIMLKEAAIGDDKTET